MVHSLSEIKMAENEAVFRKSNERITNSIAETKAVAAEEGQLRAVHDLDNLMLLFLCECMDDTCRERIALSSKQYEKNHKNKKQFTVLPGHHNPKIERIIRKTSKYYVVQKFITPPDKPEKLHPV